MDVHSLQYLSFQAFFECLFDFYLEDRMISHSVRMVCFKVTGKRIGRISNLWLSNLVQAEEPLSPVYVALIFSRPHTVHTPSYTGPRLV